MDNPRLSKLQHLLETSPRDPFLLHAMGIELQREGRFEEAVTYHRKALEVDPAHLGTFFHLGKCLERMEQWEEALEAFDAGIALAAELKEFKTMSELTLARQLLAEEMEEQ